MKMDGSIDNDFFLLEEQHKFIICHLFEKCTYFNINSFWVQKKEQKSTRTLGVPTPTSYACQDLCTSNDSLSLLWARRDCQGNQ